jgi:hypothetical protein
MKRRIRRFDEGGDVNKEFARPIKSTDDAKSETAAAPKKTSFNAAFAAARRAGDKTFEWEGKKYGTAMKGETKPSAPQGKTNTTGVDAGIAAAKDQEERRKQIRNINTSPRLDDILAVRNMSNQVGYKAQQKNKSESQEEQKRVADLQSTSAGRALTNIQAPRITKRMQDNQAYADATKKEFQKRDSMAQSAYEGQGYDYDAMKKGGRVKKMASGGTTKSASSRGDGIAQRGKTRGKMC